MRTNEVRLSDSEHQLLEQYREVEYDPTVPYGFVIRELVQEARR